MKRKQSKSKKVKAQSMNIFPDGTDVGIITILGNGGANIWMKKPIKCGCGRMVMIVVNRLGRSYCVACMPKETK